MTSPPPVGNTTTAWLCTGCGCKVVYAAGIQHAGRAPWCIPCDQPRVQVQFQQEWVPVDATS